MTYLVLAFFINVQKAHADNIFGKGTAFTFGLGQGSARIENPDKSEAHYKMLTAHGKGLIPLSEDKGFSLHAVIGAKYLDLENNANNGTQSELANLIGPGAGLQIRMSKFIFGGEFYRMTARHHAIGTISQTTKYDMNLVDLYGGISIPFNQLSLTFTYSQSSGKVPQEKTGLSASSPYTDHIYWLQFTYFTGAKFDSFMDYLF